MIIMPVKEGENIERALKKFKRKYERTGVLKELRRRQYFTKPSVAKREAMMHAIYVEHTYRQEEYYARNTAKNSAESPWTRRCSYVRKLRRYFSGPSRCRSAPVGAW